MKRIWIALAFLILSLSICIFEQSFIEQSYKQIEYDFNQIEYKMAQSNDYKSEETELTNDFIKYEKIVGILCDKEDVNELKMSILEFHNSNENEKIKALKKMRALVDSIYLSQRLSFENIV